MAEFRGMLYVFVDKPEALAGPAQERSPDDIFALRAPGEMLWYQTGWAIGRSSAYCARTSTSRLRAFETFTSAMDYVRSKRKNRPLECFYLVYVVDGHKSIITSLEQIQQLDAKHGITGAVVEHKNFDMLAQRVGKIVATNALLLLQTLTLEGETAARGRFSSATYARLWQVLHEAELVATAAPLPCR